MGVLLGWWRRGGGEPVVRVGRQLQDPARQDVAGVGEPAAMGLLAVLVQLVDLPVAAPVAKEPLGDPP